jgi:hypothetical protein
VCGRGRWPGPPRRSRPPDGPGPRCRSRRTIAAVERAVDPIELERQLAEPDDVRAQTIPTGAGGGVMRIAEILAPVLHRLAGDAAGPKELAVHVDQIARAGALVQAFDVLGHDQHLARPAPLEFGERHMCGIGADPRPAAVAGAGHRSAARSPDRARTPPGSPRPPGASPAISTRRRESSASRTRPRSRRRSARRSARAAASSPFVSCKLLRA